MKLLLTVAMCFFGLAHAQFYISVPQSNILVNSGAIPMAGLAIGTYHLYENFGIRATAQTNTVNTEGLLDGTYAYGEGVKFYTGAGIGYSSLADTNISLGGFVGVDFDAASVISLFLEIRPTYYISRIGAVQIRSGINFHIPGPTPPRIVREPDQPWLEPYSPEANDANPNG